MPEIFRDKHLTDIDITREEIADKGLDLYPGSSILVFTTTGQMVYIHRDSSSEDIYCGPTSVLSNDEIYNNLGYVEDDE